MTNVHVDIEINNLRHNITVPDDGAIHTKELDAGPDGTVKLDFSVGYNIPSADPLVISSLSKLQIGDQVSFKYMNGEIVKGKVKTTNYTGAETPYITLENNIKYYYNNYVQPNSNIYILP